MMALALISSSSSFSVNTTRSTSLSHLLHPHPLNLTWHLIGPSLVDHQNGHEDNDNDGGKSDSVTEQDEDSPSYNKEEESMSGTPLVTIENILPWKIVTIIVKELKKSVRTVRHPNGQYEHLCILQRDGLPCGNERWIDFNTQTLLGGANNSNTDSASATSSHGIDNNNDSENDNKDDEPAIPRDIFEQAVIEIAKQDITKVLQPHIAKHVIGVSWRLLMTESGQISSIFHYDTDEDTEYVIPDIPLIYPLLSTVTYLSDAGEPTLVLEHTQLIPPLITSSSSSSSSSARSTTKEEYKILYPQNAYISMPKTNKHLAFDSRLFHGSAVPLSKKEGKFRLVIGMNFHTHQSFESKNEDSGTSMHWDKIIPPIHIQPNNKEEDVIQQQHKHSSGRSSSNDNENPSSANDENDRSKKSKLQRTLKPTIQPWNSQSIIDRPSHKGWESFHLFREESHGYDFCLYPCFVQMQLPLTQIRKYDDKYPGSTLGFRMRSEDFDVSITGNIEEVVLLQPEKQTSNEGIREARSIAMDMLKKRCDIYKNDLYEMSPPLNQCK